MAAWRRMGYVVAVVLLFLTASHSVSLKMLDEEVYIRAGAQQWSGVPPALTINPEHPPLAKYIIGIAPHVVPTVAGLAVVFLSGWLGRLLGKSFWLCRTPRGRRLQTAPRGSSRRIP